MHFLNGVCICFDDWIFILNRIPNLDVAVMLMKLVDLKTIPTFGN